MGQLGRFLRTLRDEAGLTQRELATKLNCKQAKINKLESGETRLNPDDLRRAVDAVQAHGPEADEMIALAKELDATHRRRPRLADEKSVQFRRLRVAEAAADEILAITGDRFPGLLHSEEYMRDLFASDELGKLDQRSAARAERAAIYDRDPAPHHRVLLGEGALVRLVRSKPAPVALAQLRHLARMAGHDSVHLRVVAFDAGIPVLPSDFTVLCFHPGTANIGYQETPVDARIITKAADVAALIVEWHEVAEKALSEADSLAMVQAEIERLPR